MTGHVLFATNSGTGSKRQWNFHYTLLLQWILLFFCRFFLRFHLNQSLIFHPCNCTSVLVGAAGNRGGFTEIRQARLPGIIIFWEGGEGGEHDINAIPSFHIIVWMPLNWIRKTTQLCLRFSLNIREQPKITEH